MYKYTLIVIFIIGFFYSVCNGQDVHFSQISELPVGLNPALTGLSSDIAVALDYKNQWQGAGVPFSTSAAHMEFSLFRKTDQPKPYLGIGLIALDDNYGSIGFENKQIQIALNAIVPANEHVLLSTGVQIGAGQISVGLNGMRWENQYNGYGFDPSLTGEQLTNGNASFLDVSAGFNWKYSNDLLHPYSDHQLLFNAGLGVDHLNSPTIAFYKGGNGDQLQPKYIFNGGSIIGIENTRVQLNPTLLCFFQAGASEVDYGLMVHYFMKEEDLQAASLTGLGLSVGGFIRNKDAVVLKVLIELQHYALGLSYDITTSNYYSAVNAQGGLEFLLRYKFRKK